MSAWLPVQWLAGTMGATALLIAIVLLLRRPVARHFGPGVAYALWLLPAARLLMPALERPVDADAPGDTILLIVGDATPVADAARVAGETLLPDWALPALVMLWLAGAAALLTVQIGRYLRHRAELLGDAEAAGSEGGIHFLFSPAADGPVAFGLVRRYVALPLDFEARFDPYEQEMALAHEIAHHKRGDLWANGAALILLSLHWFNPLAWIAWRNFRFDQEASCDALMLRRFAGRDRAIYGRALAKAATGRSYVLASPMTIKESLKERLTMLSIMPKSLARTRTGQALVAAGVISGLALTATVAEAGEDTSLAAPFVAVGAALQSASSAPAAPAPPAAVEPPLAAEAVKKERKRIVVVRDGKTKTYEGAEADDFLAKHADIMPPIPPVPPHAGSEHVERHVQIIRRGKDGKAISSYNINAPMVETGDCDGSPEGTSTQTREIDTKDGKRTVTVICTKQIRRMAENAAAHAVDARRIEREAMAGALEGLRSARESIASDRNLSADQRAKALAGIEKAIAQMRADSSRR